MEQELIPLHTSSYDSLTFVHTKCVCIYKKVGYTPLQVVRDILPYLQEDEKDKITYVGRLDPMAEGWMHVLWNGDLNEKARIASYDKVYEVEILCGVSTDTGDVLGLIQDSNTKDVEKSEISNVILGFIGPFTYPYPKYSSPSIKKTLQGDIPEERLQKGSIYSIEEVGVTEIESVDVQKEIEKKLLLCNMDGDFRLEQIKKGWELFFENNTNRFMNIKVHVHCSSGTYMRTLAEELGKKLHMAACALSIKRIGIKSFLNNDK